MSRLPLACVFLVAAACSDSPRAALTATVRDSAGVQIVATAGDPWTTEPRWRLSAEPAARIGATAGEAAYEFDRITGIAVLTDGRTVVANGGTPALRWFGPDGRFLFERGGRGEGPGEFEQMSGLTRTSRDSVVVLDRSLRRVTAFAGDGSPGTILRLESLPARPLWGGQRLADGSWVIGIELSDPRSLCCGVRRSMAPLFRVSPNGLAADTIGVYPTIETEATMTPDRMLSVSPATFGRTTTCLALGDQIYVATADRFELDVYRPDGILVRSIRVPDANLNVTEDHIAGYARYLRAGAAAASPEVRAEIERRIASLTVPATVPAHGRVLVDETGQLWVGEYRYDRTPPSRFLVFDHDGRFVSGIDMPTRFTPMTITRDRVWGVATNSLDVQHVAAYAIER
jgi:hypothetical protein